MSLDLQSLIEKLDPICRKSLEGAAEFCVSQTNYNVELEHLLARLLDVPTTDIQKLLTCYDIEPGDVKKELTRAIDRFKRGNSRTPALSPHILQLLEQAWLLASLHFNTGVVHPGAVFLALLDHDALRGVIIESSPLLNLIPRDTLRHDITEIFRVSDHDIPSTSRQENKGAAVSTNRSSQQEPKKRITQTPSLDQFTIDLTIRAKDGLIDPIQGRDNEIRQLIDILTRRRQNNPILTGEAGVGKTAIVEGFAIRIAKGDVPPPLKNISLRILDLALLQAGAGIKGEFEKRLKSVIDEVKGATKPVILFIDEAHTMIGAGGPAGGGDAANLLKPALARGELRTIAATTWSEYKKYFEKDSALVRRFQVVKVDEPEEDVAVEMLRGIVANLEEHHLVTVLDDAVWDAVRLSMRYITGRQLPDKAISVLDTACARVAIGQTGIPPEIEETNVRSEQLNLEISILEREQTSGLDHADRIGELKSELQKIENARDDLEKCWKKELKAVQEILDLKKQIQETVDSDKSVKDDDIGQLTEKLKEAKKNLEALQGDNPMVPLWVDSNIIASVVSNWTGIPVGKMLTDEINTVLQLKEEMSERIIGQPQALDAICQRIRTYRADLDDPGKPVGVFLLVGPSGIGKTETAVTLAELLYGGDRNMISINMSEYQEAYTVSGLKGAPPGYVGYGTGGVLTEAVRQNPYSTILLDEIEKAHPDVMELFYQVFDKGIMEDSEGLTVDFKNSVILLTSNLGSEVIMRACYGSSKMPDPKTLVELVRPELLKHFKPAFLGRLVIIPYYPLNDDVIKKIARLKLAKIQKRFRENHRAVFTYSEDLVAAIAARCSEVDTGARNVDHILTQTILPEISIELLRRMSMGENFTGIYASLDSSGEFLYRFDPPLPEDEPRRLEFSSIEGDYALPKGYPSANGIMKSNALNDEQKTDPKNRVRQNKRAISKKSKRLRDILKRIG